jgi:hypothetical protein
MEITDALTDLFILRGSMPISDHTTAMSSSLRPSEIRLKLWEPKLPTFNPDHLGRTDAAKASTGECEMSC